MDTDQRKQLDGFVRAGMPLSTIIGAALADWLERAGPPPPPTAVLALNGLGPWRPDEGGETS